MQYPSTEMQFTFDKIYSFCVNKNYSDNATVSVFNLLFTFSLSLIYCHHQNTKQPLQKIKSMTKMTATYFLVTPYLKIFEFINC